MKSSTDEEGYTEIYAWGADRCGQLGFGNKQGGRCYSIPKFCTFNVVIRRIACGEEHSAFITNDGAVYSMGSNSDGRLGIGDRSIKMLSAPCLVEDLSWGKATELSCGWGHTAIVLDNGEIFTWGVGTYGALGIPKLETQWRPVKVEFKDEAGVMIKQVSCGTRHTGMIDSKGRLFVCGAADAGQLGIGSKECKPQPIQVSSIKDTVVAVACGIFHTLVLTSDRSVLAMGGNNFGQLGIGNKRSSLYPIIVKGLEKIATIAAANISAAVTENGEVFIWGTGVFGEYLIPTKLKGINKPIKKIKIGGNFGAAVDCNGALYTWGSNTNGELGLGDFSPREQGSQVISMQGKCIEDISCGGSYAIALGRTVPHKFIPTSRSKTQNKSKEKLELEKELDMQINSSKKEFHNTKSVPEPLPKSELSSKYRENIYTRNTEETKKNITPSSHVEILETYKKEQEKCNELRKRIAELQRINTETKMRESSIGNSNQLYQNKLIGVESQLTSEKNKCANLLREYEEAKINSNTLDPEIYNLQDTANDLEITAGKLRRENSQMQTENNPSEGIKVSAVLKDYEDRIEQEIADRRRITKEKANEVRTLQDEAGRNENTITKLQMEKNQLSDNYMEEVRCLEAQVNEQKQILDKKIQEKEELIELKKQDSANIEIIEDNIAKVNDKIKELQFNLKDILNELKRTKENLIKMEEDLNQFKKENENCQSMIHDKEAEFINSTSTGNKIDAENMEKIKQLQEILDEKSKFNKELQESLLAKIVEIDSLNKDINNCIEIANKARSENTDLKKIIEDLEVKNKRFMESMNLHIYNRAAEYKERTIRALKATQSPERLDKLRSSGYKLRHVTPSPERFEKFMKEESRGTIKGVNNIAQLTQFKADTIEGIKNKKQSTDLNTPERKKLFDGKFVVDQVDNSIEEDPNFVKSNYVLVQLLDKYKEPYMKNKIIEEDKESLSPGLKRHVSQYSQEISSSNIYMNSTKEKLKESVLAYF